jgi:hypothetical protein
MNCKIKSTKAPDDKRNGFKTNSRKLKRICAVSKKAKPTVANQKAKGEVVQGVRAQARPERAVTTGMMTAKMMIVLIFRMCHIFSTLRFLLSRDFCDD